MITAIMRKRLWSFVSGVETDGEDRKFLLSFDQETLHQIGYPVSVDSVPEGLLIEGCAQASGLSLFLEDPTFPALPVLARVNQAHFSRPLSPSVSPQAIVQQTHLSEAGAVFECRCFANSPEEAEVRVELLLGFLPFADLPFGGVEIQNQLSLFLQTFTA